MHFPGLKVLTNLCWIRWPNWALGVFGDFGGTNKVEEAMGSLGLNVDGDLGLEIGDGPCPTKPMVSGNIKKTSLNKKKPF